MTTMELWHKEAASLEEQLARLRKLLFNGQINDIEYAKAVMRMHPKVMDALDDNPEGVLLKGPTALFTSKEWVEKNEALVSEILDAHRGLWRTWSDHYDDQRLLQYLGWSTVDRSRASGTLHNILELYSYFPRNFTPKQARIWDVNGPDPKNWMENPESAISERQFTQNAQEVLEGLKQFHQLLLQGIR